MTESFLVRGDGGGSALRDPSGIGTQLRNDPETDPLVLAGLVAGSSLSAAARTYTSAEITWGVPSTVSAWTSLLIVGSNVGAPITPLMGDIIVQQDSTNTNVRFVEDGLQPGKWRYYTLFLYVTAASPAYLPVARADVLIPAELGAADLLWDDRTPEYYRSLDEQQSAGLGGPLRRFYELLGFEIDRINTFANTVTTLYDLDVTPERLLPRLADSLGVANEPDLGGARYRDLIKNFATISSQKATGPGVVLLGQSITGCQCDTAPGKNLMLSSMESSGALGTGSWISLANATVGNGSGSGFTWLSAVAIGSGTTTAFTSFGAPIASSTVYDFSGLFQAAVTGRTTTFVVYWYTDQLVFISNNTIASFTDTTTAFGSQTVRTNTFTSPSTARYALLLVTYTGCAAAEEHRFTNLQIELGASQTAWETPRNTKLNVRSQRVNLCLNPSWAGSVASPPGSWTFTGGTAAVTTATAISGTTVTVVTATGTNDIVAETTSFIPVTTGVSYGASVFVKSQDSVNCHLVFKWYDVSNSLLSTDTGSNVATNSTGFTNVAERSFTAPALATQLKVSVVWTAVTSAHTVTADACLIEAAPLGNYFDGANLDGGATDFQWEGSANASRSHYVANRSVVISRLLAYMNDFMPNGSSWQVVTNSLS